MSSFLASPKMAGVLGTYNNFRGKLNMVTLVTAFVLSIMVINNHNQCQAGKGYPTEHGFVKFSYAIGIIILIIVCLLFGIDLVQLVMSKMKH
jgi:hypothetical protein